MAIDPNNLAGTATLTFAEEFNSLSLWNGSTGRWGTNFNFGSGNIATFSGNQELQWYIDANNPNTASVDPWTVQNGVLTLTAAPSSDSVKPYINNYNYTSGMLTSQHSFSQMHGYFEIRAKLPEGQGLWPAFWLLPVNGNWRPELDAMEVLGHDPTSLWQFSHPADRAYDRYFNNTVPDMSDGFHRYGVDWQPDKITFYFDGQVMGVAPTAPEYNQPMYMILNLAIGGSWAGPPNGSTSFPAGLQVDYVRAYQAGGSAPGENPPPPPPPDVDPPPPPPPSEPPPPSGQSRTGTSGNDTFTLSPSANLVISGYDAAGQDALGIPTGSGGFSLAGYSGQPGFVLLDASAWWNNISGAQVVRWTGDPAAVDSAAKVDGLLQAMPGNGGGGVLFVADGPGNVVSVYYDHTPSQPGGASLVARLDGVSSPAALNGGDFRPNGSPASAPEVPPGPAPGTGTGGSGADVFRLSPSAVTTIGSYDQADALGVPTGSGGFQLAGYTGQAQPRLVDASAWWSNISGVQVVRWTGDLSAANTAAEVDALLEAMPGNGGGGRLFVGGAAGGDLGVYYDPNPGARGDAALVAIIDNLTDPRSLVAEDFHLFA